MKHIKKLLYSLLIILTGSIFFTAHARQKQGSQGPDYQLDVKQSKLLWNAPGNRHHGFILFNSGTLSGVIAGHPTRGHFSIDMNSMRSTDESSPEGRERVDDELRSEGFFAVSRYPTATIVVNKIRAEPNGTTFSVYGDLTIKNVTKPIEFTAILKQQGNTITAKANLVINRENWNINLQQKPKSWNLFDSMKGHLVDNDIPVSLNLVFTKK
ncbi:YceI family protein [Segetibacter sp. 3557_3]|uniref:YceI family protein n=1 Tax=Segetibacter sp. 3557_3 TaxID=2547429 RepID=UPI001058F943|nr:YceI family protein [Segetibacter sp. 3557_3]TDH28733.1 YceI family protein [Segetibacter sp. 3557_3]